MAVAVLGLVLTALYYINSAQEARTERDAAKQGVVVLERARRADEAALGTADTITRVIREQEELHRADTEEALAAYPDWADQPVPDAVLDSLRH